MKQHCCVYVVDFIHLLFVAPPALTRLARCDLSLMRYTLQQIPLRHPYRYLLVELYFFSFYWSQRPIRTVSMASPFSSIWDCYILIKDFYIKEVELLSYKNPLHSSMVNSNIIYQNPQKFESSFGWVWILTLIWWNRTEETFGERHVTGWCQVGETKREWKDVFYGY